MYRRVILILLGIVVAGFCLFAGEEEQLPTIRGSVTKVEEGGRVYIRIREATGSMKSTTGEEMMFFLRKGEKRKVLKDDRLQAGVRFVRETGVNRYELVDIKMLPPGAPLPYEIIREGKHSTVRTEIGIVLGDGESFSEVWEMVHEGVAEKPELPRIDFDKRAVLAIFMGSQTMQESRLEIIDVTQTGSSVNVYVRYVEAGREDPDRPTTPFLLVETGRPQAPVVFIDEKPRPNCDYHVKVETLAEGEKSSYKKEETLLIEGEEELKAIWEQIYERKRKKPELPKVDFDRETVVFAAWGRKKVAGYKVSVSAVYQRDDRVHVLVRKHIPGHGGGRGLFAPFVLARFPGTDLPIVIDYEMELVGKAFTGLDCKIDKGEVRKLTGEKEAEKFAEAAGLGGEGAKFLKMVNYEYNMVVCLFVGGSPSTVELKTERVYRTEKEIIVELSGREVAKEPSRSFVLFVVEKSDLPVSLQFARIRKESYPLKPQPEE